MMMSFEICSAFEICACREMRSESEAKGSGHESDCFTTSARTKPIAGMDDRAHPAELSARSVHPAGDMLALFAPPMRAVDAPHYTTNPSGIPCVE
jgi:hypothetical protein